LFNVMALNSGHEERPYTAETGSTAAKAGLNHTFCCLILLLAVAA
jgi:hypothetical protein